jgi:hypothetical protein
VIGLYIAGLAFFWIFFYLVIKSAVKNGIMEANRAIGSTRSDLIIGYPPDLRPESAAESRYEPRSFHR